MNLRDHLLLLEEELLSPATRHNPVRLTELLAPEFLEFGSSGRAFTLSEIIADLSAEHPNTEIHLSDFILRKSTYDWALVTYRSTRRNEIGSRSSLRSSTWIHRDGRWQMLFHQGTPIPATTN